MIRFFDRNDHPVEIERTSFIKFIDEVSTKCCPNFVPMRVIRTWSNVAALLFPDALQCAMISTRLIEITAEISACLPGRATERPSNGQKITVN